MSPYIQKTMSVITLTVFINNIDFFSLYQSQSMLDIIGGTHYFKSSMTVLQLQYVFS